jgi:4-aminobutyrate aminotransferase-like enzyme
MHENYDVLQYGEDEYTYGSHPLPCATALATLDVLQKTDLLEQVRKKATRIEGHLARLKHKHPAVADYRGEGLLWGIEIREHESGWNGHTRRVFETLLRKGVISRIASGGNGNVLIVKPPLVITEGEIDRAFEAIDDAFAAVSAAT